jgi:hypothetical protein
MNEDARKIMVLIPEGDIKTLGWLAEDYVVHMQHHLDQIFNPDWPLRS